MPKPIRVLHIVGAMNRGGVESWLMALLRHADRAEVAMDFLVHTSEAAAYDAEIAALGGRVISCPSVHSPGYIRDFDDALRRHGPYDVVHSHVHWFSGVTTTLARRRGIGIRIAHSHSNTTLPEAGTGLLRRAYRFLMRCGIFTSATHLLGVSDPAAGALFGARWRRCSRAQVVYTGLDFAAFAATNASADRQSVRREFGIEPDETVLGHVGSVSSPKNHAFLVLIAASAMRRDPRICVLCVGDGPLRSGVEAQFKQAGVRAIFAGLRSDVPRLLRAMDVFVFPSIHEGLPLALIEAQAAGLPCVVSTNVTQEVEVVSGLLRWLPLAAGAGVWSDAVLESASQPSQPATGFAEMRRSAFSVETSFEQLRSIYGG